MSNIKSNNHRKIDCRIIDDMYMDFMLSKDDIQTTSNSSKCISANIAFNNQNAKYVVSNISWDGAKTSDDLLDNIGYTGVDNGFISYDRDRIGNDEFLDLYTNSKFDLSTFGDKFFMSEISGNMHFFQYPIEHEEEYAVLKGGFYQGFFKVDGNDYQTLPHRIGNEWNFNITLRPRAYETASNILNKRHPSNAGIFFYIGTRAENKFWELYKRNTEMGSLKEDESSDYCTDYNMTDSNVIKHQYHEDIPNRDNRDDQYANSCECNAYFEDGFDPYGDVSDDIPNSYCQTSYNTSTVTKINPSQFNSYDYNETNSCGNVTTGSVPEKTSCLNSYFEDEYTGEGTTVGCDCPENDLAIEDDYIAEQISLEGIELTDSKGYKLGEKGFYEIETDNKFIIFNRTKDGFNKNTWKESFTLTLTGKTDAPNINYFPYLNHTSTGYTKDNLSKLIEEHSFAYDVFKDIQNNAFALKINDDGSISYRYCISDCDTENGFSIKEETSLPGLISNDEWNNIHLKMVRTPNSLMDINDANYKLGKMKIYIYVNGYLKFVSQELTELNLHRLDDLAERQEGVPYNISIGGGTQGLSERVFLDYYNTTDYILPLERNFGGSFIGDIKSFNFYDCYLPYSTIYQLSQGF